MGDTHSKPSADDDGGNWETGVIQKLPGELQRAYGKRALNRWVEIWAPIYINIGRNGKGTFCGMQPSLNRGNSA